MPKCDACGREYEVSNLVTYNPFWPRRFCGPSCEPKDPGEYERIKAYNKSMEPQNYREQREEWYRLFNTL